MFERVSHGEMDPLDVDEPVDELPVEPVGGDPGFGHLSGLRVVWEDEGRGRMSEAERVKRGGGVGERRRRPASSGGEKVAVPAA